LDIFAEKYSDIILCRFAREALRPGINPNSNVFVYISYMCKLIKKGSETGSSTMNVKKFFMEEIPQRRM